MQLNCQQKLPALRNSIIKLKINYMRRLMLRLFRKKKVAKKTLHRKGSFDYQYLSENFFVAFSIETEFIV
jgi:hypothetical protein